MQAHFGGRRSHVRTFETIQTDDLRRRMERAIETLIATLDALDGDTDFEPANDDEPNLGWLDMGARYGVHQGGDDDREDQCDDEGFTHG